MSKNRIIQTIPALAAWPFLVWFGGYDFILERSFANLFHLIMSLLCGACIYFHPKWGSEK